LLSDANTRDGFRQCAGKVYRQRTAPALTYLDELLEAVIFFHEREIGSRSIDLERRYRKAPGVL
jgi:hypothetical protein